MIIITLKFANFYAIFIFMLDEFKILLLWSLDRVFWCKNYLNVYTYLNFFALQLKYCFLKDCSKVFERLMFIFRIVNYYMNKMLNINSKISRIIFITKLRPRMSFWLIFRIWQKNFGQGKKLFYWANSDESGLGNFLNWR